MELLQYADASAALLNADLTHLDGLLLHLATRPELRSRASDRDCMLLRKVQRELRPIFDAGAAGRVGSVTEGLNWMLAHHPVTPQVTGSGGRITLGTPRQSVAEILTGEALLGLLGVVSRLGADRLGSCGAPPCARAFVDTSPNHSRRYCSDRCATRANVAAYRARRRAGEGA